MMMIVLRLLPLLGLKSRWHRHFRPRPLNKVFFQGGRSGWIRGLLARNPCAIDIQSVHTRVDSCGLRGLPAKGDSTKSNVALGCRIGARLAHRRAKALEVGRAGE